MLAPTHQNFGLTFGLAALIIVQLFGMTPANLVELIGFFLLILFGSLLPDLDTPNSKLGRKLWPISFVLSLFVKHRTATHSFLFIGIVATIGLVALYPLTESLYIALAVAIGTSSHIAGDWLTNSGVPLLHPFIKKRFRAPVTFYTGSFKEKIVSLGLAVINVGLFFFLLSL